MKTGCSGVPTILITTGGSARRTIVVANKVLLLYSAYARRAENATDRLFEHERYEKELEIQTHC